MNKPLCVKAWLCFLKAKLWTQKIIGIPKTPEVFAEYVIVFIRRKKVDGKTIKSVKL